MTSWDEALKQTICKLDHKTAAKQPQLDCSLQKSGYFSNTKTSIYVALFAACSQRERHNIAHNDTNLLLEPVPFHCKHREASVCLCCAVKWHKNLMNSVNKGETKLYTCFYQILFSLT